MKKVSSLLGVMLAGWAAVCLCAQSAAPLRFEVVSIRPDDSGRVPFPEPCGQPCGGFEVPAGQRFAGASSLDELLWVAYGREYADITGGPEWRTKESFRIDARADKPRTSDELRRMVQSLLQDRFQLKTHEQKTQMQVYRLVLARKDGKLGPGIKPAKDTNYCATANGDRERCGGRMSPAGLRIRNGTIQEMGDIIGETLERPVVDRTGLKGRFDIDMEAQLDLERFGPTDRPAGSGPAIFTALSEQLGLKLESAKELVDTLVVDSASRPEPN